MERVCVCVCGEGHFKLPGGLNQALQTHGEEGGDGAATVRTDGLREGSKKKHKHISNLALQLDQTRSLLEKTGSTC